MLQLLLVHKYLALDIHYDPFPQDKSYHQQHMQVGKQQHIRFHHYQLVLSLACKYLASYSHWHPFLLHNAYDQLGK